MPLQAFAVKFNRPLSIRIPLFYHRCCCWILGLHVVVRGRMSSARPTLFVSNHCSYADISVLASRLPASFVAKAEVATWPIFGWLAKLQRTVFVDRRGPRVVEQRNNMVERLEAHENLILFPEGTSSDGNRVLPFKSALFSVAQYEIDHKPLVVQPVSIAYTHLDGMPLGRALRPHLAWYGAMSLLSHVWTLIGLGTVTVELVFHAPVTIVEYGSRKALSDHCFEVIRTGLAAANAGIGSEPAPARQP